MKLFTDYHMHPQGHRLQPYTLELLQPWADSCLAKGITDFCFTDHDRYHLGVDFNAINLLREKNPDLNIRAGIELDNDPVTSEAGCRWVEEHWDKLDFVLGSIHYLPGKAEMFDSTGQEKQFTERSLSAVYADYLSQLEKLIGYGYIDCMSHLDLIKIHKFIPAEPLDTLFLPILKKIKAADLAMEINTAGWRKPIGIQYPDVSILKAAIQLGIPLTISSDAHSHVQVGEGYDRLATLMTELGIREIAVYHRHQRKMVPLT